MRSRFLLPTWIAAALLLASSFSVRADEADEEEAEPKAEIGWLTSYAAATKQAESTSRPLLFKFYTGWCPHCTRMDQTTWVDEGVAKLAEGYVAAKVNADVEKVPVKRYRLVGYPTVIVAEPGGEEVFRLEGYKDAKVVGAFLKTYLAHAKDVAEAHRQLRTDKASVQANAKLGQFYASAGLHPQAADRFLAAAKTAQGEELLAVSAGAATSLVKAKDYKAALKAAQPALTAAGAQPPPALLLAAGQAAAGQGDGKTAREHFERLLQSHPQAPEATAARDSLAKL